MDSASCDRAGEARLGPLRPGTAWQGEVRGGTVGQGFRRDVVFPDVWLSEADTWGHPVDYSLPRKGIATRLLGRLARRR